MPPQARRRRQGEIARALVLSNTAVQAAIVDWAGDVDQTLPLATRTIKDWAAMIASYHEFIGIVYPAHVGREWEVEGLLEPRLRQWFTNRIITSQGTGAAPGVLMTYTSMLTLRWHLLGIIIDVTAVQGTPLAVEYRDTTFRWCVDLQMRLKLRTEKSLKSYFGPMEARLIIEHMLDRPRCYNLALGQVIATLFELMLGARPSSLYAVQNYKDCYMCFRDVEVIREDGRGYFTIIVTLRWFKGYHAGQRIKIRFRLGPTRTSHGLIMDVGCCTVAYGLRLGFFKNHTSLQSLIDGDELHIEWKDEVLNQPFFRAGGPRGMSLTSSPLSDKGRREYLRLVFEAVGLPVTTGYAFRRHFARVMRRGVGAELTRQAMGHNAGSTALETHYDDGVEFVDFVGHMLAKEDAKSAAQMQDGTEAALRRGAANRKPPVLSFAQLLQRQPALAVLAELIHNMKLCLEDGAVDWKSHTTEIEEYVGIGSDDDAMSVYLRAVGRVKRLVSQARQKFAGEWHKAEADAARKKISLSEVRQRMEDLSKPSNLPTILALARQRSQLSGYQGLKGDILADDDPESEVPNEIRVEPVSGLLDDSSDPGSLATTEHRLNWMFDLATLEPAEPDACYCIQCEGDVSCTSAHVDKNWKVPSKLAQHENGTFHQPKATARRLLARLGCERKTAVWWCPWCPRIDGDKNKNDPNVEDKLWGTTHFYKAHFLIDHMASEHAGDHDSPAQWKIICDAASTAPAPEDDDADMRDDSEEWDEAAFMVAGEQMYAAAGAEPRDAAMDKAADEAMRMLALE